MASLPRNLVVHRDPAILGGTPVFIGTRVPVTLPQKLFDGELIEILAGAEKVWIQTHFNHPREVKR